MFTSRPKRRGRQREGVGQACGQEQCNVPAMWPPSDPQTAKLKCWTNLHRYAVAMPNIAMTAKPECWTNLHRYPVFQGAGGCADHWRLNQQKLRKNAIPSHSQPRSRYA